MSIVPIGWFWIIQPVGESHTNACVWNQIVLKQWQQLSWKVGRWGPHHEGSREIFENNKKLMCLSKKCIAFWRHLTLKEDVRVSTYGYIHNLYGLKQVQKSYFICLTSYYINYVTEKIEIQLLHIIASKGTQTVHFSSNLQSV